jgi:LPXTG-motif cell wall-anchored protein
VAGTSAATADQTAQNKLPQTASPLPLLGLLGFGSLLGGLLARRK